MATIKLRLCDEDRERWGGPEWTVYDDEEFLRLNYDQLAALERDLVAADNVPLIKLILIEWPRRTVLGIRGMLWLTRQLAGVTEPKWNDFKPQVFQADVERVSGDDVVPPPDGSLLGPSGEIAELSKTD